MNDELLNKVRHFNRNAILAERDGFTVDGGYVWSGWGNPAGPCARKVCRVEDYDGMRDCVGNVKSAETH